MMRKLVVNTFLSLDGVMQGPGGPEEDTDGGFALGGWSVPHWDDAMGQAMDEAVAEPFELLLGRRTYESFAAHWPRVTGDPTADALNRATKHVASTTLARVDWQGARLLQGDVAEAVAALKGEPGPELQVHGSAGLLQTLLAHDLVDELRLWVFPVVLAGGKRLFGDGAVPRGLRLVRTATSTTGVTLATYERVGDVAVGSFALEQPDLAADPT